MKKNKIHNDVFEEMLKDRAVRIEIVKQRHIIFFSFYFNKFIEYEIAPFQEEMFAITEDEKVKLAVFIAFRGSAKSTIITTSYVLWSILGIQQKKFVVILSQTEAKARQHLQNIKRELESNDLLRQDLGPFQEESNQWGAQALFIPRFNAKIMISSTEQSIRGMRHGEHRPDLFILDDVEDTESVKTQSNRDKVWDWLTKEVVPAGDRNTRIIAVGNLLHEDSLLKKLQNRILNGEIDGIFREYPIVDEENNPLWLGKFPKYEDIQALEKSIMNPYAWSVEYLLKFITPSDQIIKDNWIQPYDNLPDDNPQQTIIGTDLAISKETSADFTTIVPIQVYGVGKNKKIYVLPYITNEKLSSLETLDKIKTLADKLLPKPIIIIENVGYQATNAEHLMKDGYRAEAFHLKGQNKEERLQAVSRLFQDEKIFFPNQGAELLKRQITGLGKEKYDDLVDALTLALLYFIEKEVKEDGFSQMVREDLEKVKENKPIRPMNLTDWINWSKRQRGLM